jgi:hypothetical protein
MSTDEKPAYSPGLAGIIAGETEICWVDPNAGLMYRGYDYSRDGGQSQLRGSGLPPSQRSTADPGRTPGFRMRNCGRRPLPKEVLEHAAAPAEEDAPDGYAAHRRFRCLRLSIPT